VSETSEPEIDFATAKAPDLHARLEAMREAGAVVRARLHGEQAWLITRHAELRSAFKDESRFHSATIQAPLVGPTMQSMVGREHRRNRELISFAFIPAAIAAAKSPPEIALNARGKLFGPITRTAPPSGSYRDRMLVASSMHGIDQPCGDPSRTAAAA